jgi:hypothetical protein
MSNRSDTPEIWFMGESILRHAVGAGIPWLDVRKVEKYRIHLKVIKILAEAPWVRVNFFRTTIERSLDGCEAIAKWDVF